MTNVIFYECEGIVGCRFWVDGERRVLYSYHSERRGERRRKETEGRSNQI